MNILLLEDDALLGECARVGLLQRDFSVEWAMDISSARQMLQTGGFDCLLLDLGLPDGDGLDLLKSIRSNQNLLPTIIITARYSVEEKIRGLEYGADDFVVKPYSLDELTARIKAVVRRQEGRASNILDLGGIYLDPTSAHARKDGAPLTLSAMEFRLLQYFLQNAGKIQSRDKLLRALCGEELEQVSSNLLDVHIHHLRKKIGSEHIKTVRGLGYIFMKDG
jgi:two-component system response regulator QseB